MKAKTWMTAALAAGLAVAASWVVQAESVNRQVRAATTFQDAYARLDARGTDRVVGITFPLNISVGLMVEATEVAATSRGPFTVKCGEATFAAAANEKWKARRVEGTPAKLEYYPVIGTFPLDQEAQARALAAKWTAQGYLSDLMLAGVQLVNDGAIVNDGRRYYVHVNRFVDEAAARLFMQQLMNLGERPWLSEKLITPSSGTVELVDPTGAVRAHGTSVQWTGAAPMKMFQVHHDVGFPQEGFEDREYEGSLVAAFDRKGLLAGVNVLDLDLYLKGVVPSEIYASDPADTIRAQAVAARGETVAGLGVRQDGQPFDTCSDQNCQEYTGLKLQEASTNSGVLATRGEVIKHAGNIIEAVYADTCGGHTENIENVWSTQPHPSLIGVPDCPEGQNQFPNPPTDSALRKWLADNPPTFCRGEGNQINPKARWTVELTAAELTDRINKTYHVGAVRKLELGDRGVSGRLKSMKVIGATDSVTILKELPIRRALGGFRSALFVVDVRADAAGKPVAWTFKGAGNGHGVGMCQVGARWAARAGWDYRKILAHYFRSTDVVKIY